MQEGDLIVTGSQAEGKEIPCFLTEPYGTIPFEVEDVVSESLPRRFLIFDGK